MNKTTIPILSALLILACTLMITACGQNGPGNEDKNKPNAEEQGDEAKPSTESGGGVEGSPGGIKINTEGATIEHLELTYDGTISGEFEKYKFYKEDEKFYFSFYDPELKTKEEIMIEVGQEVPDRLQELYIKSGVEKWNGFDMVDRDVVDGYGFSLTIVFSNGERLTASGRNQAPENYFAFKEGVEELFRLYIEEYKSAEIQKIIEQGVKGELNYVLVNFMEQHGHSYEISLINNNNHNYNFSVRIRENKGEFFEEGEYMYYTTLPLEAINFKGIRELVEKYELMQWHGWESSSKDYGSSEWFQLELEFDEGSISAQGTDHPENYEAFRREFLELIAEMIEIAKQKYGLEKYVE